MGVGASRLVGVRKGWPQVLPILVAPQNLKIAKNRILAEGRLVGFPCSSLWHGGSGRAWLSVTGVSVPFAFYCFVPVLFKAVLFLVVGMLVCLIKAMVSFLMFLGYCVLLSESVAVHWWW